MNNGLKTVCVSLLLALLATAVRAAPDIYVVGLFKDRAVLMIDGTRRLLATGETSAEGVKLISATSESAVIEVDGKQSSLTLGARAHTRFQAPDHPEVQIWRDAGGMYSTVGSINGQTIDFLVDTGATVIAMNEGHARKLGIDFRVQGQPTVVTTASGVEQVYGVMLKTVGVGDIQLRDVPAVVMPGAQPPSVLLGMSFLGRLEMQNDGRRLVLKKTY